MSLIDSLKLTVHKHSLIPPGARLLVAVSGGPDSLALIDALIGLRQELNIQWLGVAHLDHGLRGEESAEEAQFVMSFCAQHHVPCTLGYAHIPSEMKVRRLNKNQAARAVRYEFLEGVGQTNAAQLIATAHTQDDVAETVLLNIFRGCGTTGLGGIPPRRGAFIRPLVNTARVEIERYCVARNLNPRRDPSNSSPGASLRNKIRLELMPHIAEKYTPHIKTHLANLAELSQINADFLEISVIEAVKRVRAAEQSDSEITLGRAAFCREHLALQRGIVRECIRLLRGDLVDIGRHVVDSVVSAAQSHADYSVRSRKPHVTIRIRPGVIQFTLSEADTVSRVDASVPLLVPAMLAFGDGTWKISSERVEQTPEFSAPSKDGKEHVVIVPGAVAALGLSVRTWQDGDRIAPFGMAGKTRKLQDVFVDKHVPQAIRRTTPIVLAGPNIIVVAGIATSELTRMGLYPQPFVRISMRNTSF